MQSMHTPGAAWVDRFLGPLLRKYFPGETSVACLQIAATDTTEAEQLRALGHKCDLMETTPTMALNVPDANYAFAFTGRFPTVAAGDSARITLARELKRVLRPGGALLLVCANRNCPVDLTRNGPLFHSLRARHCLSLGDAKRIFLNEGGFRSFEPLNVCGHQGWNQLPVWLRWVGKMMDNYWRWLATPSRSRFYFGPLNPTLALWLKKD